MTMEDCSVANGVQAPEKLTANKKAKADAHFLNSIRLIILLNSSDS